jgi:hypothetical protein
MKSLHARCVPLVIGLFLGVVTSAEAQTARTAPTNPIAPGMSTPRQGTSGIGPGQGSDAGVAPPPMAGFQNPIPGPLPPPSQPPIINGPLSQSPHM